MRLWSNTFVALACTAAIAGCAQSTGMPGVISANAAASVYGASFHPSRVRANWLRTPGEARRASGLAVAEFGASSIYWFKENDRKNKPPTVCEPADSTNGIRIDRHGNLWVPNGKANTTTEYAPHCGAAELTIDDSTGEPADVGFDRRGNVYILNLNDVSGPPTVNVYDASGTLLRTLSDPSFSVLFGVNADNRGDVFVSNLTSSNKGIVVEFEHGKMPGKVLSGVNLGLPGAPSFDSSDNLIISDFESYTIDIFAPPYTAAPMTTPLTGASIWCPLDSAEKHIYCGDADNGAIDVYAYPGATYLYSYSASLSANALVTGVAPDPPQAYWKR